MYLGSHKLKTHYYTYIRGSVWGWQFMPQTSPTLSIIFRELGPCAWFSLGVALLATHCPSHTSSITFEPTTEKDKMTQMGIRENDKGKWVLPDGREVLPKSVVMRVLRRFHEQTHWGTQALVD